MPSTQDSKSFPEDGSSSAPSHGSTAAGDWHGAACPMWTVIQRQRTTARRRRRMIGKNPSQVHRHGYSLHISAWPSRVKLQGIVHVVPAPPSATVSHRGPDIFAHHAGICSTLLAFWCGSPVSFESDTKVANATIPRQSENSNAEHAGSHCVRARYPKPTKKGINGQVQGA